MMRLFPTWLLSSSHVRRGRGGGLIRIAQRRFFAVTPSISQVEGKALETNETRVLQALTSLKNHPYRALTFLKRIERNDTLLGLQAYATVIRILCNCSSSSSGLDEKLEQLLVELISKVDEGRGFSVRDLLNLIEEEEEVLSKVCVSLVKAYANLNMFGQAVDTYCYSLPCVRSLNFIISRMNACGEYSMSLFVFRKYGSVVDLDTRVLVVKAYRKMVFNLCDEMKMDEAEELVLDMEKNHRIAKDVFVYSAIIQGHRKATNFPRALQFFDEVVVQNGEKTTINRVIASSVLDCCCQMGKFAEAYDLFNQFRELKVSLDRFCYNVAFDALVKLGQTREAVELFRGMIREGIAPDVVNYTTLIGGCCLHGEVDQALDLVMEMEKNGETPDIVTYNVLVGGLARNGHVEGVNRTLELMESRGVKPTSVTYNMVIRGLAAAGKTHEANAYHEKSPGNDASFIKAYCETGRLDEAFERFDKLDFPLPRNVYFILVNSLCASGAHHIYKAQLVLNKMYKLGVEPGKSMHGIMIGAWCRVRKVENALRNFKLLLNSREIIPDKYTYTTMINTYCLMKRFDEAYDLFQDMKKRRVVPDLATYTVFEDHEPRPDIMREMKAFNFEPDVYYYTAQIHRECVIGEVENAEYIFRRMIETGVEPDDVAYAALINGCCRNECAGKAQELVHEMVEKGMTPPEPCLVAYVKLIGRMVENGMTPLSKALEVLHVLINEMAEKGMTPHETCKGLYVTLIEEMVENEMTPPPEACKYLYVILVQEMVVEKGMTPEKARKEVYVVLVEEIVGNGMRPLPEACEDLFVELIREMVEKGLRTPNACRDLYVKLTQRDGGKWDDVAVDTNGLILNQNVGCNGF